LIGLTKQAIKKTLGRAFISLDQLQTVVIEIESMLNDRPLTYVNSDLQDSQPLTPSHLLHGRRIQQVPHSLSDPEELTDPTVVYGTDLRNRMDKLTQLMEHFSSRWKREYLTSLREFYKTSKQGSKLIRTGDVVIVHEDNKPRLHWRLAMVENLIEGNDGEVRAAHIRTCNRSTTRPVAKLFPLEVHKEVAQEEIDQSNTGSGHQQSITTAEETVRVRPVRAAAERAREKIKEWSEVLARPGECREGLTH